MTERVMANSKRITGSGCRGCGPEPAGVIPADGRRTPTVAPDDAPPLSPAARKVLKEAAAVIESGGVGGVISIELYERHMRTLAATLGREL